jgi:hypothetical protein
MLTATVRPTVRVSGGELSAHELALLTRWIALNQDVLVGYWNGDIEYTEDAIKAIKPLT